MILDHVDSVSPVCVVNCRQEMGLRLACFGYWRLLLAGRLLRPATVSTREQRVRDGAHRYLHAFKRQMAIIVEQTLSRQFAAEVAFKHLRQIDNGNPVSRGFGP